MLQDAHTAMEELTGKISWCIYSFCPTGFWQNFLPPISGRILFQNSISTHTREATHLVSKVRDKRCTSNIKAVYLPYTNVKLCTQTGGQCMQGNQQSFFPFPLIEAKGKIEFSLLYIYTLHNCYILLHYYIMLQHI